MLGMMDGGALIPPGTELLIKSVDTRGYGRGMGVDLTHRDSRSDVDSGTVDTDRRLQTQRRFDVNH